MSASLEQIFETRRHELRDMQRDGLRVLCEDSTPVLFNGEIERARTVTIGINPSWHEFYAEDGRPLPVGRRRFAHLSDFCGSGDSDATQALGRMRDYFTTNPFKRWFGPLRQVVAGFGDSFSDRTAAHTDIISCFATHPTWSKLEDPEKQRLAASGYETLAGVLRHATRVERLIIVGTTAREALAKQDRLRFDDVPTRLDSLPKFAKRHVPILCQALWRLPDGRALPVIGLKPYLKGTPGAPLSYDELRSVAGLLQNQPLRKAP